MTGNVRFAITVGAGRNRPQGKLLVLGETPSVAALSEALGSQPSTADGWWSAHAWERNERKSDRWRLAIALVADIDYHDENGRHSAPPEDVVARLEAARASLPGNLLHLTPRGARLILVPSRLIDDPDLFKRSARGFGAAVDSALRTAGLAATRRAVERGEKEVEAWCAGYKVDEGTLADLARFYYLPNARVDGVDRVGRLHTISTELLDPASLARVSQEPSTPTGSINAVRGSGDIDEAVAAYNRDHAQGWPTSGGTCPTCGHSDCFGTIPGDPSRWACFSASHAADSGNCGLAGAKCWHGDALDLDSRDAGISRVALLIGDGYLRRGKSAKESDPVRRRWKLQAGEYEIVEWPKEGRRHFVTLEYRYDGLRVLRDNLDLNSRRSRARFSAEAKKNLPTLIDDVKATIDADLRDLIGLVEKVQPRYRAADGGDTIAELLVAIGEKADLFHDATDRAFATADIDGHRETMPVRSKRFSGYLRRQFRKKHDKVPNSQALADALGVLEGFAQFDGPCLEVHVRVAEHDGAIYIDLGRPEWEAVKIDATGWSAVSDPPVRFVRPPGLMALPLPVEGGSLQELRPLVNLHDDHDWVLFQAWLVAAFRPGRPFTVLIILGEQGSAKSTAVRVARRLIDPSKAGLRSAPRGEHDLVIAARNGWCLAFDNISSIPSWLSDAICRLATGSGFGTRRLYTDDEEEIFEACRPIALNGIEELAGRGDLIDRALPLTLDRIQDEDRMDEERFWAMFGEVHARVLGALFDAVCMGLRRLPDVKLPAPPRMADFARFVSAAEPALDCDEGAFMRAYEVNRVGALASVLDATVFAKVFVDFAESRTEPFEGTASKLLEDLNEATDEKIRNRKEWPKAANALSGLLRRLAPSLRRTGIAIEFLQEPGNRGRKLIRLSLQKTDADRRIDASASIGVDCVDDLQTESEVPLHFPPDESPDGEYEEGTL